MLLLNDLLNSLRKLPERPSIGALVHTRLDIWQQVVIFLFHLLAFTLCIGLLVG